jgi:hypothetical protein
MRTIFYALLLLAASPLSAQRPLVISGLLSHSDGNDRPMHMTLMTGCGDTLALECSRNGRFHFRVHRGASYVLSFEQEGSLSKDVVVDAALLPSVRRAMRVRHIRFDVVMDAGDPTTRMRYTEPAGYIRFRPKAGSVHVLYDEAVEERQPEVIGVMQ